MISSTEGEPGWMLNLVSLPEWHFLVHPVEHKCISCAVSTAEGRLWTYNLVPSPLSIYSFN